MRWATGLAAGVALAALAILALPQPAPPGGEAPPSPLALALDAEWGPRTEGARFPCSTCHYGPFRGFDALATREDRGARAAYDVSLVPVSGYELALAWAAPRRAGDGLDEPLHVEQQVRLPPGGGAVRVPFALPFPARALMAEARPADQPLRPPLSLALEGRGGDVASNLGSAANRHAFALAPRGAALEGAWTAVLAGLDPADGGRAINVTFRAIPVGYEVRVDDGRATGSRGRAHDFAWELPAQGRPGAPERFQMGLVAFNDHPTDVWSLPVEGDRAFYEGNVSASRPAPPPPAPFTAADVEAAWQGRDALLLHEHAFDGVQVRSTNARGERTHAQARPGELDLACPACSTEGVDAAVMPAMPPGTTHVRVAFEWQGRHPLAPVPEWTMAVSQRPEPDFRYPAPAEEGPGRRLYVLPVQPHEWERGDEGWLQVWPLMVLDADGRAAFDGTYTFRVEAARGPLPG